MCKYFLFLVCSLFLTSHARTNSYFTMTGDRVMINLQSGHSINPESDQDAFKLFEGMNVEPVNSMMGWGKKIQMEDAMTIVVSHRSGEQYDGTIMVYRWPGARIDYSRRQLHIKWSGDYAAKMFSQFHTNGDTFEFESFDSRLKIFSNKDSFELRYDEYQ